MAIDRNHYHVYVKQYPKLEQLLVLREQYQGSAIGIIAEYLQDMTADLLLGKFPHSSLTTNPQPPAPAPPVTPPAPAPPVTPVAPVAPVSTTTAPTPAPVPVVPGTPVPVATNPAAPAPVPVASQGQ